MYIQVNFGLVLILSGPIVALREKKRAAFASNPLFLMEPPSGIEPLTY